jgi:hypothetical protein
MNSSMIEAKICVSQVYNFAIQSLTRRFRNGGYVLVRKRKFSSPAFDSRTKEITFKRE